MLLLSGLGWGYALNGVTWSWQDHPIEDPFVIDAESFPDEVGTEAEIQDAVETAMADWNAVGRDASLTSGGLGTGEALEANGLFGVHYEDLADYSTGGTLAFAATWTWDGATAFDCDVTFLESNDYGAIDWDAGAEQDGAQIDVQATALHELGHCLGLDHSGESSAVMYAYYSGLRTLTSDDMAGLGALYGDPCVDGDGDGYSDCAGDCDDANAAVNPGGAEVCNGADDNCDGVVDASTRTVSVGDDTSEADASWASSGNVYSAEAGTLLHGWRQHIYAPADTRLVWTLHVGDSDAGPWTLVRSERSVAVGAEWETSPTFDHPLEAGRHYVVAVGIIGWDGASWWKSLASRAQQGPIKPKGAVFGRALGDEAGAANSSYLWQQELNVEDLPDEDGDGVTAVCGDCATEDATIAAGQAEACDAVDNDCDGAVDEDFGDGDADGTVDCLDPCPADPEDDADGDGLCGDVDPCPDDPTEDCVGDTGDPQDTDTPEDSGVADTDDTSADTAEKDTSEEPSACGCTTHTNAAGPLGLGLIALSLVRRRRERAST